MQCKDRIIKCFNVKLFYIFIFIYYIYKCRFTLCSLHRVLKIGTEAFLLSCYITVEEFCPVFAHYVTSVEQHSKVSIVAFSVINGPKIFHEGPMSRNVPEKDAVWLVAYVISNPVCTFHVQVTPITYSNEVTLGGF